MPLKQPCPGWVPVQCPHWNSRDSEKPCPVGFLLNPAVPPTHLARESSSPYVMGSWFLAIVLKLFLEKNTFKQQKKAELSPILFWNSLLTLCLQNRVCTTFLPLGFLLLPGGSIFTLLLFHSIFPTLSSPVVCRKKVSWLEYSYVGLIFTLDFRSCISKLFK